MRCSKCGFHSFDYLDSCKKCGADLTEQKLRIKFQGYVAAAPAMTLPETAEPLLNLPAMAETESEAIDFGFDVLAEKEPEEFLPSGNHVFAGEFDQEAQDPEDFDASTSALAADNGLLLDQPFNPDGEGVPDNDLPKFDDRFDL